MQQPSDLSPQTTATRVQLGRSLSFLSLSSARTRPNWNIWLTVRVIIIFFKLVCANFSLCESFPLAIQLAPSPPLSLFLSLSPSRCRAVFSCCRCFCVQPQIILSKTLSPIFLHPQRVFLCAFSPAAPSPLPSSSSLFFLVASSVFTMLLVIMRFVKFKERTTFGLQHHRLSVLVVMRYAQERRLGKGRFMANKLPNLRQQQVDLVRTFEKRAKDPLGAAGNRTLRSLSFATSTISRQLATQYVLLVRGKLSSDFHSLAPKKGHKFWELMMRPEPGLLTLYLSATWPVLNNIKAKFKWEMWISCSFVLLL